MKRVYFIGLVIVVMITACNKKKGPVLEGQINLSSQLLAVETDYLYGYNFKESDYIKFSFPFSGSNPPDIINIPFKNPDGSIGAPGFNAPSGKNGFLLLGEFNTLKGWVYIREQGKPDPVESVGLSLTAKTGEVDPSADIVIAPSQNAFYDALLNRFAERTVEEVQGL